MPKLKTLKLRLNKTDRKEIDRLYRLQNVARYGVETANQLHFEAGERLWKVIASLYPELGGKRATYDGSGVLTYTPKENKP